MGRRGTSARQSRSSSRSSRSRRKKFGGPQPQRNHRAQLRSHARHVHEAETEIDFPVGVPRGLTPPTSNLKKFGGSPIHPMSPNKSPLVGGWGGESARDPNREIDFGFVFVHVSCVRAKLCAMIPLWLGAAKLFSAPPAPVGGWTSRDVPTAKTIDHHINITKKSAIFVRVFPVKNFVSCLCKDLP